MPMAVERSPTGNHSAIALVTAGKPPPSPIPRRNRQMANPIKTVASPCAAQANDHAIIITAKPVFVPMASINLPPAAYIRA